MSQSRSDAEVLAAQDRKADRKEELSFLRLENMSEYPQSVFDEEGVRHTIPEYEVRTFSEDIGEKFLAERTQFVRMFTPTIIPSKPGMPTAWVANMTGNPFLPSEVEVERVIHGELTKIKVPNPLKVPCTLNFEFAQDQEVVRNEDDAHGDDVINHPPHKLRLPPYSRQSVPADMAMWMQERDGLQDPAHIGKVKRCRAPGENGFEPNETWKYDDIRIYAALIDDKHIDLDTEFPAEERLAEDNIPKARDGLLRSVFFRIVDTRFSMPTRAAFERAKANLEKELEKATAPDKPPGNRRGK